jgi:hypothetical protein
VSGIYLGGWRGIRKGRPGAGGGCRKATEGGGIGPAAAEDDGGTEAAVGRGWDIQAPSGRQWY